MNKALKEVFEGVTGELKSLADPKIAKDSEKYYREKIFCLGIKTPLVRKVSSAWFKKVKGEKREFILNLCEELMKTGVIDYMVIAQDWFFRLKKSYGKDDFKVLDRWVTNYINNWGTCDDICTHSLGYFLIEFPEFLPRLKEWAKSENRWEKRAAAVSLIYGLRRELFLKEAFEIADILLLDEDDLVQKGYGWMLKEAARYYEEEVFNYVLKHKKVMPRTALRYAIEKMPIEKKKVAMAK